MKDASTEFVIGCVCLAFVVAGGGLIAAQEASEETASENAEIADAAYQARDWVKCAEHFARASRLVPAGVHAGLSYNAACCHALSGNKEEAFAELKRAVEGGWRDAAHMQVDNDLDSLHDDPRWAEVLAGVESGLEAYRGAINRELLDLYDQDQGDRRGAIDWDSVAPRDEARRKRVDEIVKAGGAKVADDYYHAAMVFQHGNTPEEIKKAHEWARRAVELDPDHDDAKWLAAAAEDRYLMYQDKPQKYGTQFRKIDGKWVLWEVDPSVTDEERARWNVPPLSQARERAARMNEEEQLPNGDSD